MSAKSKPSLSDTPSSKGTPATPKSVPKAAPRVAISKGSKTPSKLSGDSPSPLPNSRGSAERSPRTVTSRSSIIGRPSPRVATPPEKSQSRILKPSELQAQLTAAQDELKKAKEKIHLVEKEKAEALIELEEARKLANDANEKLLESVVAQKQAEESSEVEKFWAAELKGDDGIDAVGNKEEEWQIELQRVKQELVMVTDTKNQALIHADEATKIAEIHAEKVEFLSAELVQLKGLLDSTSKTEARENADVMGLKLELNSLKQELELAKGFEKNLAQKEESCELLKSELTSVKEELERTKDLEKVLAEKEESSEQLKLEFESVKQELEKAKGLQEILGQKEESMIAELDSLKQELEKAKNIEEMLSQREETYEQVKSESDFLKHELEKAKCLEENLFQKDESLQQLKLELELLRKELSQNEESFDQMNIELEASRIAEAYTENVLEEWKNRVDALELQVKESSRLEKSLDSVMKQLERNGDLLHEAECEVNSYKEKVSLLEMDLDKSEGNLVKAREEASTAAKEIVSLKSVLESLKDERTHALENEKIAVYSVQELKEEKVKLINELEALREEEEKSKTAMESLASALHEVSVEGREVKEKLLSTQSEHEAFEKQIEDLNLMLKKANEKYESQLNDAKCEINHLTSTMDHSKLEFESQIEDMRLVVKETDEKYEALLSDTNLEINQLKDTIEHLRTDHQNTKSEWEQKEVQLVNCLKTAEDEKLALRAENEKCESMLNDAEHDIDHLRTVIEQSKIGRFEEDHFADKTTDVNYGTVLDDAKDEIKHLSNMIEKSKVQYENSRHEWEKKQLQLMNAVNRSEEQKASMEKEIMRVVNLLREKEEVARTEKEDGSELRNALSEAISEANCLREALEEVKVEETTLKTDLQDRERQLLILTRENEQLRARKQTMENGDLSDTEKDYDMLPRVVEFSEENGHAHQGEHSEKETSFSQTMTDESKEKGEQSIADSGPKMWESCKIDERDFSIEREGEHESVDDELDQKAEVGEGYDQVNGGVQSEGDRTSPTKEQQQKKKKPLYRKFGSLLKKGIGNGNQK